jgi:AcrR family transcriptional regulator
MKSSTRTSASAARRPTAGARSRPYHHGDLRTALLEAAARMAAETGPASVTLREVARRAGVSQAAPYHHFADKAALLAAVAEEGFRRFDVHQAEALTKAPEDPVEQLADLGVSYLQFALTSPHYFQVMFRPSLVTCTRSPEFDTLAGRSFERLMTTTTAARRASGQVDADPYPAALAMWAMPHGLAGLYLEHSAGPRTSPVLLESIVRAASRALAAAPLGDLRASGQVDTPASAGRSPRASRCRTAGSPPTSRSGRRPGAG